LLWTCFNRADRSVKAHRCRPACRVIFGSASGPLIDVGAGVRRGRRGLRGGILQPFRTDGDIRLPLLTVSAGAASGLSPKCRAVFGDGQFLERFQIHELIA